MTAQHHQTTAPASRPIPPAAFGPAHDTALWWLTNAGFLINCRGALIMLDPAISMDPASPGLHESGHRLLVQLPITAHAVPRLDAVLYTHSDSDHLAPITARALAKTGALFAGPPPVAEGLADLGLRRDRIQLVRPGEPFRVAEVEIVPTPADHPWQLKDPARFGAPFLPEDCCGYLMRTPDGVIWCPGDTRLMSEHLLIRGVDLLLVDASNSEYHLGPKASASLADNLPEAALVPYHYGCYDAPDHEAYNGDPAAVAANMRSDKGRLQCLAPGERFPL
jgi:L-ascorbate metabolism protein UlaG (beta-lactamase superfamily)